MLSIWAIDIALCLCTSSLPRLTARVSLVVKRQRELHVKVLERHTPIRQSNWELFSLLSPSINRPLRFLTGYLDAAPKIPEKAFWWWSCWGTAEYQPVFLCICCWQYRTHFGSNRRRFSGTPPSDPWILLPRPSAVVGYSPSSFSRLLIAAVIDGCEIWHTSDALVILPYLHVSRKYCKWFRFISVLSGRSPNPTTTLSLMTSICEIYTKSKQHNRAFLY